MKGRARKTKRASRARSKSRTRPKSQSHTRPKSRSRTHPKSRRSTRPKSRKTTRSRSAPQSRTQHIEVFVYGPQTDQYQIQPTSAPTVTKLNVCEQKGYYSCQMSPMCNWNGTQTHGACR
jgi:hypothetical protein